MTNPNYTHLAMVVDRSGSMKGIHTDMNGAILELIETQASLGGELRIDITTFDDTVEFPYVNAKAEDITGDIITPRGMTALNDAVGRSIQTLGVRLAKMSEEERPGKVIFVIITDGLENMSREYTHDAVKTLVEEQTDKWGWEFLYLAANVDAFATGAQHGYGQGQTISFAANNIGTSNVVNAANEYVTRSRSGLSTEFTDEERIAASGQ